MGDSITILATGFAAQIFFSARILVQWILSERAGRVLSPSVFWVFSIAGAYLLCLYGWMRGDFAIVFGQFVSYYIYLWNLHVKGHWRRVSVFLRGVLVLTPVAAMVFVVDNAGAVAERLLHNGDVPLWLLLFGVVGQLLFTLRFVYQWLYSRRKGQSVLPAGFWAISLAGSAAIVGYGAMRADVVIIVGQSFGLAAYVRNLYIIKKQKDNER